MTLLRMTENNNGSLKRVCMDERTQLRSKIVIGVTIVLVVVAVIAVWLVMTKLPGSCKSCRIMPMCKSTSKDVCKSSTEIMTSLYVMMEVCANTYVERFGGTVPKFYLKEHTHRTFSYMKRSIHIVIRKPDGSLFDNNTLVYVCIHELAHVLCGKMDGNRHGPDYMLTFDRLLDIAQESGYYNPEMVLDDTYPSE